MDNETIQAKLRNKLSPFWTLTGLMADETLWANLNSTENGKQVIRDCVKQCNDNKAIILELIDKTEKQLKYMNNEKYNQIIDNAYKNYCLKKGSEIGEYGCRPILLTKEEFINKIKTDDEFSEKWGLKIKERELSLEERLKLMTKNDDFINDIVNKEWIIDVKGVIEEHLNELNTPTRAISITYNNETTEIYE